MEIENLPRQIDRITSRVASLGRPDTQIDALLVKERSADDERTLRDGNGKPRKGLKCKREFDEPIQGAGQFHRSSQPNHEAPAAALIGRKERSQIYTFSFTLRA